MKALTEEEMKRGPIKKKKRRKKKRTGAIIASIQQIESDWGKRESLTYFLLKILIVEVYSGLFQIYVMQQMHGYCS